MVQTTALRRLFTVSRPISWINTAYPFAATYLVLGGTIDTMFFITTLFFLIPYNLLMYGVNDVFDYESDIRNPRKGGIEGAIEQRSFHPVILWSALILALPFVVLIAATSSWTSNLVLLTVLFFVIAYSIKTLRFKERPVLDSITSSIHFVGPMLFALSLFHFPPNAWPICIAFFLWGIASHAFGAVQDIIPDRKGGLASIGTVFGARTTVIFSTLLYVISIIIIALQGSDYWIVAISGVLYVINSAVYLGVEDNTSSKTNSGWRRFLWINYFVGTTVTLSLIVNVL